MHSKNVLPILTLSLFFSNQYATLGSTVAPTVTLYSYLAGFSIILIQVIFLDSVGFTNTYNSFFETCKLVDLVVLHHCCTSLNSFVLL